MSFGRFVCIYGIGYAVYVAVNTCVFVISLKRKYGAFGWILLDDYLSDGTDISFAVSLLMCVCSTVFWPVMVPINLLVTMRAIDKISKGYDL